MSTTIAALFATETWKLFFLEKTAEKIVDEESVQSGLICIPYATGQLHNGQDNKNF
jgi:hypothetical protein